MGVGLVGLGAFGDDPTPPTEPPPELPPGTAGGDKLGEAWQKFCVKPTGTKTAVAGGIFVGGLVVGLILGKLL